MKTKPILYILTLILLAGFVSALPPFTVEFRGTATIDGESVQDGTVISIWANDGNLEMDSVKAGYGAGYYNHLEIRWDDPNTEEDEGLTYDDATLEKIIFKIDDKQVTTPEYVTLITEDKGKTKNQDVDLFSGQKTSIAKEPMYPILILAILSLIIYFIINRKKRKSE